MSDQTTNVGSLDELIVSRVTEFINLGIDNLNKVSLLEAAWNHPSEIGTTEQYSRQIGTASMDAIERDLAQLAESGFLMSRQDENNVRRYFLTADQERIDTLKRLLELWADPNFRIRAATQLHYSGN
jgi:hypothetical protein